MFESSKSVITGLKYSAIAAKTAGIAFFNKDASQKYLLDTLSSIPGLSAKAAQILSMKLEPSSETKIKPMPLELVKQIIEEQSPSLSNLIEVIEEKAMVASLGQVHKAQLKDGRIVAIKVQYPGVRNQLEEQFRIIRKSASFGPPKKYQLAVDELTSYFHDSLLEEVDYLIEAQKQIEFRQAIPKDLPILVPNVHIDLSTDKILVQDFEFSMPLSTIQTFWPKEAKSECARLFVEFFLKSAFESGLLHSDPHPNNYGFRPTAPGPKYSHELVLYDFGSTLKINKQTRSTVYQLISGYKLVYS